MTRTGVTKVSRSAAGTPTRRAEPHDALCEPPRPHSPSVAEAVTILSQMSGLLGASQGQTQDPAGMHLRSSQQSYTLGDLHDFNPSQLLPSQPDIPMLPSTMAAGPNAPKMSPVKNAQIVDGAAAQQHRTSKGTRRGPMDEMRQLARILVKIIPHSTRFLTVGDEGGGGNRITEEQIKSYLKNTLGEAPHPQWGVPGGWGAYLAELFTWCSGRRISEEQAMRCAKREPGRSWEAIEVELNRLGLRPETWPLPLTRKGMDEAAKTPVVQPMPLTVGPDKVVGPSGLPATKRPADDKAIQPSAAKRRVSHMTMGLDSLTELQLWHHMMDVVQALKAKQGGNPLDAVAELVQVRKSVVEALNEHLRKPISPMIPAPMPSAAQALAQPHAAMSQAMPAGALAVPPGVELQPLYINHNGQLVPAFQLSNTRLTQPLQLMNGIQSLQMVGQEGIMALQGQPGAVPGVLNGMLPQPVGVPARTGSESLGELVNLLQGPVAVNAGIMALANPGPAGYLAASPADAPRAASVAPPGIIRPKATKLSAGMDVPTSLGEVLRHHQESTTLGQEAAPEAVGAAAVPEQKISIAEQQQVWQDRKARVGALDGAGAVAASESAAAGGEAADDAAQAQVGKPVSSSCIQQLEAHCAALGDTGALALSAGLPYAAISQQLPMALPGLPAGSFILPGSFALQGLGVSNAPQPVALGAFMTPAPSTAFVVSNVLPGGDDAQRAAKMAASDATGPLGGTQTWKPSLTAVLNK